MCGLPGSGKTTLARRLERERAALRFTPDEWLAAMAFEPFDEAKRAAIEAVQWRIAARALELGSNVVLDFGFWSRRARDEFRARANLLGATAEVRFLEVDRAELWNRLQRRNAALAAGDVRVTEAQLDEYVRLFEAPTPEELA